ncbi:uncharacterized protein LOC109018810 [Juglans regia]|uniref:Uncharacterized protein LOC109018810 n=1 Tax=Juglans regia TaxID=51240 RepID=A0A2I4HK50_JUGRE|nr:uncharacterized protein LOC109018810 [Juglans regia]
MHQMSSSSKSIVQDSDAFQRSFPSIYSSSSAFASSTSTFASRSSTFFSRYSTIPKPVNLHGVSPCSPSSSPSVRFSIERPTSPGRSSISVSKQANNNAVSSSKKKACTCSPTTHPGSFRCSLHRTSATRHGHHHGTSTYHLNFRRSAMTNSLVRIGGVEGGDLVRRALSALIRPSSHQQRRRAAFHPRPSRLSAMSTAEDS